MSFALEDVLDVNVFLSAPQTCEAGIPSKGSLTIFIALLSFLIQLGHAFGRKTDL